MTQTYLVTLRSGSTVEIEDVVRIEKDGAGTRLYGGDGETLLANFEDGTTTAAYPITSRISQPEPEPEPEPESTPEGGDEGESGGETETPEAE